MRRPQRPAPSSSRKNNRTTKRNKSCQGGNIHPSTRGRRNQRRASNFRTRQETTRQIRLIDLQGNEQFINQQGRMNIKKHQSVLSCLEKRALRYRKYCPTAKQMDEVLYQEALDETGTVLINSPTDFDKDSITSRGKKLDRK